MYKPSDLRYEKISYARCGKSGLKLPAVSLGLWHNFGEGASYDNMKDMCHTAFEAFVKCHILSPLRYFCIRRSYSSE